MQEQSKNNNISIGLMRLEEAQGLVRLYESYATPERMLQALKSVDESSYEELMGAMVVMLESEHETAYELVRERLLDDALEAQERRKRKNELQREKRANARREAERANTDQGEVGGYVQHMQ